MLYSDFVRIFANLHLKRNVLKFRKKLTNLRFDVNFPSGLGLRYLFWRVDTAYRF
jgi:hypothetical protein